MSIQPNQRLSLPKGDFVPATGEPPSPADLFTGMVTELTDAKAGTGEADGVTMPAAKGAAPTTSDRGKDVTASVEQLLALVTASHGRASPRQPKDKGASEEATQ